MVDRYHYQARFQRVVDYIYEHLDEPLDLNSLADIAHMSPTHWHRVYQAICGETLAATVKRLRLHQAAARLINTELSVEQIARSSGYSALPSFNRAFSQAYGLPPARFRAEGSHSKFVLAIAAKENEAMVEEAMMDVRIEQIEQPIPIVGVRHQGPYIEIGKAFEKLNAWLMQVDAWRYLKTVIGIYHDDPTCVAPQDLRSHACAVLKPDHGLAIPDEVEQLEVAAGRYAVLRFKGPYAGLQQAYHWLFSVWLPQSGEELGDQPCFEDYLNNPREVAPEALLTDIYLPLRE
ncbi:AraC family transcriptional regulator [Motiliproteus coralliicola]|uniref:AraC family transcriptional regulator n=1 Tax=Motiliproteus coralliicola TaxID=2283196 RepID=A0A369WZJ7_9GAMM|nr:AraC family transcriptional regulator [Motiliproteus coralliicola]RDE24945.1 AraC family transcriptional regulator [Motiliproteus coralliicola]